jgi:Heterokaryon incompatibility protein (HET)
MPTLAQLYASKPVDNDSIRLLVFPRFHQSKEGRLLDGDLQVIKLEFPRDFKFFALSYCWGGESPPREVICVGDTDIPINTNLNEALVSLTRNYFSEERDKDDAEFKIWVDALCINQTDEKEKAHQISLMGEIYINARVVMVWLGGGNAESNRAMEYISKMQKPCATQKCEFFKRSNSNHPWKVRQANSISITLHSSPFYFVDLIHV